MTSDPKIRRQYERKVTLVLELLDDAEGAYPEIAAEVRQFAPTILTTALGVPVNPARLTELLEAKHKRDAGEDQPTVRYWERRYDDLMAKLLAPALRAAS